MAYADVNGVRLFYTDDGADGPPLLLVHGWACDSHDWSWQIDAFAEQHRRRQVVLWDDTNGPRG